MTIPKGNLGKIDKYRSINQSINQYINKKSINQQDLD